MNNRQLLGALAIGTLILAGAAAIGLGAYNAGVAQGMAESGRMIAAPPAGTPYVSVSHRPWGFFPFFPLLFLVLFFFVVMRGLLWRARWHGGWRYHHAGVPPAFEEWHRRAHAACRERADTRASRAGQSSSTGTASAAPEGNRAG